MNDLRFLRESYKNVYKEAMSLQDKVFERNILISEYKIKNTNRDSIIAGKDKEIKNLESQGKTYKDDNAKLLTREEEYKDEISKLKDSKSKWKTYAVGLSSIITGTIIGIIVFK